MADSPRIVELKRRVQLDPASIVFAVLAEEYRRAGRFQEAIATCIAGLQRHPSYLSAHVTLGRALIEVGRFEDADEELQYVLQRAPENLAAIRGLADIHHRRGDVLEHYPDTSEAADVLPSPPQASVAPGPLASPALAPPANDPALAGLQAFLASIVRARGERDLLAGR